MTAPTLEKLRSVNASLSRLCEETRRSLSGERRFTVELVRELAMVLAEMDPVLPRSSQLRQAHPDLAAPLDEYIRLATELRCDLEKARLLLLSEKLSLESSRSHVHAVSEWTAALASTR